MTTTPRSDPRSLGARLAARIQKPRRRPATADAGRQRPKSRSRPTQLEAEAQRILETMEAAFVERRLGQSHRGRELLRLSDARTQAKFREDFARLGVHSDTKAATRARQHHSEVCNESRYGDYDEAHFKLKEAEAALRKSTQIHAAAVEVRERVEFDLRALERPVEGSR